MFGIKTKLKKIEYRNKNKHNYTEIKKYVDISKIEIGKGTYGIIDIWFERDSKLFIGNYCSIADNCKFMLGGEHDYNTISTYPFKAKYLREKESKTKGDIIVEDDVWIGYGSTILSGVRIGQGAVIGAKSIVAKDVPPYAIYVGNKVVKYRFSQNVIKEMLKIDFSKLDEKFIKNNIEDLYAEITEENAKEIVEKILLKIGKEK